MRPRLRRKPPRPSLWRPPPRRRGDLRSPQSPATRIAHAKTDLVFPAWSRLAVFGRESGGRQGCSLSEWRRRLDVRSLALIGSHTGGRDDLDLWILVRAQLRGRGERTSSTGFQGKRGDSRGCQGMHGRSIPGPGQRSVGSLSEHRQKMTAWRPRADGRPDRRGNRSLTECRAIPAQLAFRIWLKAASAFIPRLKNC